eukprot:403332987
MNFFDKLEKSKPVDEVTLKYFREIQELEGQKLKSLEAINKRRGLLEQQQNHSDRSRSSVLGPFVGNSANLKPNDVLEEEKHQRNSTFDQEEPFNLLRMEPHPHNGLIKEKAQNLRNQSQVSSINHARIQDPDDRGFGKRDLSGNEMHFQSRKISDRKSYAIHGQESFSTNHHMQRKVEHLDQNYDGQRQRGFGLLNQNHQDQKQKRLQLQNQSHQVQGKYNLLSKRHEVLKQGSFGILNQNHQDQNQRRYQPQNQTHQVQGQGGFGHMNEKFQAQRQGGSEVFDLNYDKNLYQKEMQVPLHSKMADKTFNEKENFVGSAKELQKSALQQVPKVTSRRGEFSLRGSNNDRLFENTNSMQNPRLQFSKSFSKDANLIQSKNIPSTLSRQKDDLVQIQDKWILFCNGFSLAESLNVNCILTKLEIRCQDVNAVAYCELNPTWIAVIFKQKDSFDTALQRKFLKFDPTRGNQSKSQIVNFIQMSPEEFEEWEI